MLRGKLVDNQHGPVSKMFLFAPTIHSGQGEKGGSYAREIHPGKLTNVP